MWSLDLALEENDVVCMNIVNICRNFLSQNTVHLGKSAYLYKHFIEKIG